MQSETKRVNENHHIARAAGIVGSATLISRILGYLRDMLIAGFLGAGPVSDAFIAAFRLPNMLRRLYHEGTFSMAVVPAMTDCLTRRGQKAAVDLARAALQVSSVLLLLLSGICALAAPWIIRGLAYGLSDAPATFNLAVDLQRIMSGYIFFIGLVALSMGLLNALGHFAAPALAPALLNLGIIGAVVTAVRFTSDPTFLSYALAIGVLIGGCMQLALQIPFLVKCGIDFWHRSDWRHPGLNKIRTMIVPVMFGGSVFQLNTLIGTLLASFLVEGSISYLYYADRLVQLPLGLFGIATATAIMPTLSRQAVTQNARALVVTLQYAVRLLALIMLPAMVGIIVVREPIIALLFEHGAFDARASRLTADAVLYYGIGLWAFAAIRIVIATFYALGDTRTPARIAVVCLLANIVLGLVLMEYMGHGGIALALTLATVLNLLLLVRPLHRRLGPLGAIKLLGSVTKSLTAAAIMGIAVWWLVRNWLDRTTLFNHLVGLTAIIAAGVLIYAGLTILLQGRQVLRLLNPKKQAIR